MMCSSNLADMLPLLECFLLVVHRFSTLLAVVTALALPSFTRTRDVVDNDMHRDSDAAPESLQRLLVLARSIIKIAVVFFVGYTAQQDIQSR